MDRRTLLQRGPHGAVEPRLQVHLAAVGNDVREQIAIEGGILLEQLLEVKHALGGGQRIEPNLARRNTGPVLIGIAMIGVGALVTHSLENHNVSLAARYGAKSRTYRSGLCQSCQVTDKTVDIDAIRKGYAFSSAVVELGVLMADGQPHPDVPVRLPLQMLNRHGLVAGATGTGKTRTLQLMAEQISAAGVPVFAADIKGDLTGVASVGVENDKIKERTAAIGQNWSPTNFPTEFYALGGLGAGVPLRATVTSFGPTLLAKVLELNQTQEDTLGLVFHFADSKQLELIDLGDLKAVLMFLTSPEGKAELTGIGGVAKATVDVILRSIVKLEAQGANEFFGMPEFDTQDLLRVIGDKGMISLLELPNLSDRPLLFSTFLMWLLADLFHELPEVGDIDKPKLVFFFDEAHLLFEGSSKAFLDSIEQTVRLIRSKGVGVFFITQAPTDIPDSVLAQLGSRVQHQLRVHTPNDAKALKATVSTYPITTYDLGQVLTTLGIGEAIVTVMDDRGAPTPVAWTKILTPRSLMSPTDPAQVASWVQGSPIMPKYGQAVNPISAQEKLQQQSEQTAAAAQQAAADAEAQKQAEAQAKAQAKEAAKAQTRPARQQKSIIEEVGGSVIRNATGQIVRTATREILRGIFGTARRR